jgi:DDE superfamily endonuclease
MWVVADLDDDYITKMEDVLELYERPYDPQRPVVCLDEKPITLHADVRPTSPAVPGREARRDNEYERCGTANVFCAVEPKVGRHFTFATPDRSGFEFAQVAVTLALAYPEARTIVSVRANPPCSRATTGDELEAWTNKHEHQRPNDAGAGRKSNNWWRNSKPAAWAARPSASREG